MPERIQAALDGEDKMAGSIITIRLHIRIDFKHELKKKKKKDGRLLDVLLN